MELPFTPLDFARRARKLYADREAVVDGTLRLSYEEFGAAATDGRLPCNGSASSKAIASPSSHRTRTPCWKRTTPCRSSAR